MSKYCLLITLFVLVSSCTIDVYAQVFNAPPAQATADVQQAVGATTAESDAVEQTAWSGMPLPKITMPKITMPNMESFTGPVKMGFGKVTSGTKKAWEGTKEMLTFGKGAESSNSQARGQKQPSFWQRLLVRDSEPQVPQTVGEFMSQPRLDP